MTEYGDWFDVTDTIQAREVRPAPFTFPVVIRDSDGNETTVRVPWPAETMREATGD